MRPLCLALVIAFGCSESPSLGGDAATGPDCGAPPAGFYFAGSMCNPRCLPLDGAATNTETCQSSAGAPYCADTTSDLNNCGDCGRRCTCGQGFARCRISTCSCSATP